MGIAQVTRNIEIINVQNAWSIGLNYLLVTYNENEDLICHISTTPPAKMQANTLDDAKVECSNDAGCTRFYSRCAQSPTPPPAQEYYKCTTASLIGSSGCGSRLYDKDANMEGAIPRFISIYIMLNKCNNLVTIFLVDLNIFYLL